MFRELGAERPISTRVNRQQNDDPSIIEPIELASSAA
jgi:hypothetical protein